MPSDTIEIRDFVLRIPGIDRQQAQRIGEEVARRLTDELPGAQTLTPSALVNLRVRIAPNTRPDELPGLISSEIVRALR